MRLIPPGRDFCVGHNLPWQRCQNKRETEDLHSLMLQVRTGTNKKGAAFGGALYFKDRL
jgi:hypothetical protein